MGAEPPPPPQGTMVPGYAPQIWVTPEIAGNVPGGGDACLGQQTWWRGRRDIYTAGHPRGWGRIPFFSNHHHHRHLYYYNYYNGYDHRYNNQGAFNYPPPPQRAVCPNSYHPPLYQSPPPPPPQSTYPPPLPPYPLLPGAHVYPIPNDIIYQSHLHQPLPHPSRLFNIMSSPPTSPTSPTDVPTIHWQAELARECERQGLPAPQYHLHSDRRGGRTAWSSKVLLNGTYISARYWYAGHHNAHEDAAEVALKRLQQVSSSSPTTSGAFIMPSSPPPTTAAGLVDGGFAYSLPTVVNQGGGVGHHHHHHHQQQQHQQQQQQYANLTGRPIAPGEHAGLQFSSRY
ncbi:hypothetical protein EX30DRAFT_350821 [Ascodesmis nigricans]|uniref:DRBM domain-containing protein n=1 Tax=Ascodesmis nigricans TaxID=341454 RepID=A0A4S2MSF2_9PEZI|nr:hypothetical protein EX30DRAFT_350821 [Ascodesmis nigricans]